MVSNQGVKPPTVLTEVILLRTEMLASFISIQGYAIKSKDFYSERGWNPGLRYQTGRTWQLTDRRLPPSNGKHCEKVVGAKVKFFIKIVMSILA